MKNEVIREFTLQKSAKTWTAVFKYKNDKVAEISRSPHAAVENLIEECVELGIYGRIQSDIFKTETKRILKDVDFDRLRKIEFDLYSSFNIRSVAYEWAEK